MSNNNIVTTDTLNINQNNIDLTKDGNFNMLYFFNGSKLFFSNSLNNVNWNYSDFSDAYDIQNFVNTSITEIEFEEGLNEYWISTLLKQVLIKCSNIKKITLPASLKKIDLTYVIQNIMQYGNTRSETDPININIKSFNTYCWFNPYYYIHNKLLDKLNTELNKLKIIYQDNFEFKFISNFYGGKYLKPLNFNSTDIDQNHYLNNMNIMLKINLLMANYLPSLGNDSNITINKKLIQEWHEQYSNHQSDFLNYIFKAKLAFSNSNETNVTINQYKITSDAWEYSYINSIADRLVNFYFEYDANINIDNLILEASNADLSNININSSYPKLKINKLNGFDKINYNDFIVNKWPRFLMNSFKKIIIPSNTNYEGVLNFQFEVEELEFGENVTFETNSRIHALRTKKLIIPESTLNNLVNYLKLVFDDQIAANNGSRYGIVSPILGYNNQGSQENYVGFDSINNLTEIRLSEWIEKYTENILPFLHDFTGKIIFDKKINLSKYCINSFDNKNYLFHGAKWSEIEFEDGVENIPSQVFINLKNLRKITFPNNKINIHYLNFFSSNLNRNIEIINGESIKHNLSWLSDEWKAAYNKNGVKLFALQIDSPHTRINKLIIEEGYEKIALDDSIFACAAKDIIQDYGYVDYKLTTKPLLDKFTLELPSTIDMIKSGSFDYLLKYKETAGVQQYAKAIEIKVHADDEKFAKIKKLIEDSLINEENLKSITIIQEN